MYDGKAFSSLLVMLVAAVCCNGFENPKERIARPGHGIAWLAANGSDSALAQSSAVSAYGNATKGERNSKINPTPPMALHGTINVLLGNRNGLVAVTDSRLSDAKRRPYNNPVPKLFQLDDQTICVIAGFYVDFGPELESGAYPASTAASNLIDYYRKLTRTQYLTVEERATMLTNIFQFSLNLVTRMNFAASSRNGAQKRPAEPSSSVLTVAGYESDGSIRVVQVDLQPRLTDAGYAYLNAPTQSRGICANSYTLGRSFECSLAGLSGAAEDILGRTNAKSLRDPSAVEFINAKNAGRLNALSIGEMIDLAKYLKDRSGDPPQEAVVGGPTQMAVLADQKVAIFDQPVKPIDWLKAVGFETFDTALLGSDSGYMNGRLPTKGGLIASPTNGAMVVKGSASGIIQPLDNIIFIDSFFDHCILTYDGSPMSIFDASNITIDSKLIVSPTVDMGTELIKQIRLNFPALRVEQAKVPRPASWNLILAGPPRTK